MTPTERSCQLCLRRGRLDGGNGTCPLFYRRTLVAQKGAVVYDADEDAWAHLYALHPDGCSNFRPGDLRVARQPLVQGALF